MSTMAILISLLLLMFFAYQGVTVLILAPLMAALAVLPEGQPQISCPPLPSCS